MDDSLRNVLINSTLAFVSAFVITTFVHESGHYLSYLFFGADPTLFHDYVQASEQNFALPGRVISALTGPVFSLIQAVIFGLVVSKNRKNTASYLLFLWLSLLGYINFFAYLMLTPLASAGDTAKIAELLNLDISIRIIIAVVGFAVLMLMVLMTAKNFSNFIPADENVKGRAKYVYRIMFFPIMIGSVVNSLLALPVVTVLSIIYPATSSYVIMSSFGRILKAPESQTSKSEIEEKIMRPLILLTVCAILLNRLLTFGVG